MGVYTGPLPPMKGDPGVKNHAIARLRRIQEESQLVNKDICMKTQDKSCQARTRKRKRERPKDVAAVDDGYEENSIVIQLKVKQGDGYEICSPACSEEISSNPCKKPVGQDPCQAVNSATNTYPRLHTCKTEYQPDLIENEDCCLKTANCCTKHAVKMKGACDEPDERSRCKVRKQPCGMKGSRARWCGSSINKERKSSTPLTLRSASAQRGTLAGQEPVHNPVSVIPQWLSRRATIPGAQGPRRRSRDTRPSLKANQEWQKRNVSAKPRLEGASRESSRRGTQLLEGTLKGMQLQDYSYRRAQFPNSSRQYPISDYRRKDASRPNGGQGSRFESE